MKKEINMLVLFAIWYALLQLYNVREPMERVAIGVLGPLPETEMVTSTSSLRHTIFVNGPRRIHSQIRKRSLSLMSLCPSSSVGLVSLVSCTLTKTEISNLPCSRRYAPCSGSIKPGRLPYIHSLTAWWSAPTGL